MHKGTFHYFLRMVQWHKQKMAVDDRCKRFILHTFVSQSFQRLYLLTIKLQWKRNTRLTFPLWKKKHEKHKRIKIWLMWRILRLSLLNNVSDFFLQFTEIVKVSVKRVIYVQNTFTTIFYKLLASVCLCYILPRGVFCGNLQYII